MLLVTTYDELRAYAKAFATGHLKLVLFCGPPGVGKSFTVREAVGGDAAWVDGNATAFGVYCLAYQNLDMPLVLDDVDRFYRDRNGTRLLTAMCQSDSGSWVSWETDAARLKRDRIPTRYYTSSHLCLVTNSWDRVGPDVRALEDRGHFIMFSPTPEEVHREIAAWFWDQEVYNEIGDHLGLHLYHSFRTYIRAHETKSAGLDWRLTIKERQHPGEDLRPAERRAVKGTPPAAKDSVRELRELISRDTEAARRVTFNSEGGFENASR